MPRTGDYYPQFQSQAFKHENLQSNVNLQANIEYWATTRKRELDGERSHWLNIQAKKGWRLIAVDGNRLYFERQSNGFRFTPTELR